MKKIKLLFIVALIFVFVFNSGFSVRAEETEVVEEEVKSNGTFKYIETDGGIEIVKYILEEREAIIPSEIEGIPVTKIKYLYNGLRWDYAEITIPNSVIFIEEDTLDTFMCVHANPNSYARKFADEHNIAFECIEHANIVIDAEIPPTCTTYGRTEGHRCIDCGTIISGYNYIPRSHKVVNVEVKASCTQNGQSYSYCEVCNEPFSVRTITPKLEHQYDNGIITNLGTKIYTCTVCGATKNGSVLNGAIPKTGKIISISNNSYKITKSGVDNKTIEYVCTNTSKSNIIIPNAVVIDGVSYKVTSIAKNAFKNNKKVKKVTIGSNITKINTNAFYGCKNLKTITIKSKNIKSIGKNAFKGIKSNAKIKVPSSKLKKYKTLFKNKGQKSTVKITK